MRLDPVVIVICDNEDCLGLSDVKSNQIYREQVALTLGWARGNIDDKVKQILVKMGWNVLSDEDFCPKCSGKEKKCEQEEPSSSSTATDVSSS